MHERPLEGPDQGLEQDLPPVADPPPAEPDFASEHAGATFADQLPGGPEGTREWESPRGYAGMDRRRWVCRWWRDRR